MKNQNLIFEILAILTFLLILIFIAFLATTKKVGL